MGSLWFHNWSISNQKLLKFKSPTVHKTFYSAFFTQFEEKKSFYVREIILLFLSFYALLCIREKLLIYFLFNFLIHSICLFFLVTFLLYLFSSGIYLLKYFFFHFSSSTFSLGYFYNPENKHKNQNIYIKMYFLSGFLYTNKQPNNMP